MAAHWPYFGAEVDRLEYLHASSRERALDGLLDELERGARQAEAKRWVAKKVEGDWGAEIVYEPADDPHDFKPLTPGFWRAVFNDPEAVIDDEAHAVTMAGHRYMPIRVSLPGEVTGEERPQPVQPEPPRRNRGGRRRKFDWERVAFLAGRIVERHGVPESQAKLYELMTDEMMAEAWPEEQVPGKTVLEDFIRKLWDRLETDEP